MKSTMGIVAAFAVAMSGAIMLAAEWGGGVSGTGAGARAGTAATSTMEGTVVDLYSYLTAPTVTPKPGKVDESAVLGLLISGTAAGAGAGSVSGTMSYSTTNGASITGTGMGASGTNGMSGMGMGAHPALHVLVFDTNDKDARKALDEARKMVGQNARITGRMVMQSGINAIVISKAERGTAGSGAGSVSGTGAGSISGTGSFMDNGNGSVSGTARNY
jgi:hypothetical protein